MANLTFGINDEVSKGARIRALGEIISISAALGSLGVHHRGLSRAGSSRHRCRGKPILRAVDQRVDR